MIIPYPIISAIELQNEEFVGLGAIEITSVPHISILQKRYSTTPNIYTEYKQDMARLLSEVFQNYKLTYNKNGGFKDISLELLWLTEEVKNQPYKASIKLYLIIRAIDDIEKEIENTINSLLRICKATLDLEKYEYKSISFDDLSLCIHKINDQSINAIVKEERIENLQNQLLPACFSFGRLPITENDLSRIVNALIDHPNCAVSFQLMPITYSAEEMDVIGKMTQALDTLNKGVMEQGVGNISFALAEKHAEVYKYYSKNKNAALFTFNILVFGSSHAVNAISTKNLWAAEH